MSVIGLPLPVLYRTLRSFFTRIISRPEFTAVSGIFTYIAIPAVFTKEKPSLAKNGIFTRPPPFNSEGAILYAPPYRPLTAAYLMPLPSLSERPLTSEPSFAISFEYFFLTVLI